MAPLDAAPQPGPHPFFDDRRAVPWYTRLADAREAAASTGRRIVVIVGGRTCGGTRALVEKSIAKLEIAEFLSAHYTAVAVEPEGGDPEALALLDQLPRREPTPVCIYLTVDGGVAHYTVGGRPAAVLLNEMQEGHTRKPRAT